MGIPLYLVQKGIDEVCYLCLFSKNNQELNIEGQLQLNHYFDLDLGLDFDFELNFDFDTRRTTSHFLIR